MSNEQQPPPDFDDDEPTLDDLTIDDSLPALQRIRKYVMSDIVLQRIFAVKDIPSVAANEGYEATAASLIPLLDEVMADPEPAVRQEMVEQLPALVDFLIKQGSESSYKVFRDKVWPVTAEATTDTNTQVRGANVTVLIQVAAHLQPEDAQRLLIKVITSLSKDGTDEEHRMQAGQLFSCLGKYIGKECLLKNLDTLTRLSQDSMFRVRKAVAGHIGELGEPLGCESVLEHVMPIYDRLRTDDIWGVRKACAESFIGLASVMSSEERGGRFTELITTFLADESRWVRSSAMASIGRFIALLSAEQVTPALLRAFVSMATPGSAKISDSDIPAYCAYSFPAVAQILGPERWLDLQPAYEVLTKDMQWKVRRTLSFSLHEVANVLGTALTERHLLPTFELFLRDLDEVKQGVVIHLAQFLRVLSPAVRVNYLPYLAELRRDADNWRFRLLLAQQMPELASLFSAEASHKELVPVLIDLATDDLARVRLAAAEAFAPLLLHLGSANKKYQESLSAQVIKWATGKSFSVRLTYCYVAAALVSAIPDALFASKFLPPLLVLTKDKVPNVRLVCARVLVQRVKAHAGLSSNDKLAAALQAMASDQDRDVLVYSNPSAVPDPLKLNHPVTDGLFASKAAPSSPSAGVSA